jgi:hypothetical protein
VGEPADVRDEPFLDRIAIRLRDDASLDRIAIAIGLAVVTFVFYVPVLDAAFLNWDDPPYVTANPNIRSLSWETVRWAFTTFQEGIWHPLTWLSLALDHALYGLTPRGFHLTNLLLHVANTVLVFLVWARLTGATARAAVVGALFGLHPMHVESVAWVTERKDVLSTFFWLVTIAAYGRYARVGGVAAYAAVLAAFALGLLSKPMLVTLPFVLLLLDFWPLGRLGWRTASEDGAAAPVPAPPASQVILEKVPLLMLALAVAAVSVVAVSEVSAAAVPDRIPLVALVGNAILSCVKYVWLTLWPANVSPWYSHPWFEGPGFSFVGVAGAVLVLLAVSALALAVARRRPYVPVGWFWYLGTLVPVLGLVYNGRQGMADRYAYIPHIGLFVAAVWTTADLAVWRDRRARVAGAAALTVVLVVLGARTAWQTRVWRDDRTFWSYTARTSRYSFIANQALAGINQTEGRLQDALPLFARATKLRPDLAKVHVQFARVLARTGHPGQAAAQYRKALAIEPNSAENRFALAQVLITQRRRASARRELERAVELRPDFAEARQSLAGLQ